VSGWCTRSAGVRLAMDHPRAVGRGTPTSAAGEDACDRISAVSHEEVAAWEGFAVALAGAAAVLAGLVFVAVSINIDRILPVRGLPAGPARA
jgi:hypothetical protein